MSKASKQTSVLQTNDLKVLYTNKIITFSAFLIVLFVRRGLFELQPLYLQGGDLHALYMVDFRTF